MKEVQKRRKRKGDTEEGREEVEGKEKGRERRSGGRGVSAAAGPLALRQPVCFPHVLLGCAGSYDMASGPSAEPPPSATPLLGSRGQRNF